MPIIGWPQKCEEADERPGAEAAYQLEGRPVAVFGPAAEQPGSEGPVVAPAGENQHVLTIQGKFSGRFTVLGRQFLTERLRQALPKARARAVAPTPHPRKSGHRHLFFQGRGYRGVRPFLGTAFGKKPKNFL